MTLNNPLPLLSVKFLGVGIEVTVERVDDKTRLCATVEALVWSKCWATS